MAVAPLDLQRGDVVTIRQRGDKARPAVVVRSDLLVLLNYATVLPITTELRDDLTLRISVAASPASGLRVVSQVMTDWPQTVRLSEMGEIIGRIDGPTMRNITTQLAVVLGMAGA